MAVTRGQEAETKRVGREGNDANIQSDITAEKLAAAGRGGGDKMPNTEEDKFLKVTQHTRTSGAEGRRTDGRTDGRMDGRTRLRREWSLSSDA